MKNNSITQYLSLFAEQNATICAHSSAVLNAQRNAAFEHFRSTGLPTRKVERYKYTDMEALFAPDYGLNLARLNIPVNPYEVFKCDVPNLSTALYFVVNDQFHAATAPKVQLPEGVIIGSLKSASEANSELVAKYYNSLAAGNDPIASLNTMLCQDGLFVYVPRNTRVEKTIQVVNIMKSAVPMMANRRVLIVLEQGAELNMLFCDHADDDREFLSTVVTEIFLGENARLNVNYMEETHVKNRLVTCSYVSQERSSNLTHNVITLHNGITRNQVDQCFQGEGAECFFGGAAISDKQQHVDNNTIIRHAVGQCQSKELYKYVLNDDSTGAFAGRVLVEKDAQKTTSAMTNQNLCASKTARMYTQPMLEIYADDVKCSHGSTIGQLNDAALFYMQQRGIPREEAKRLLQQAFIGEVIDNISIEPLRDRLRHLVEKRFRGELNKCEGCKMCK